MRDDAIDPQVWQQHAWLNRIQSFALLLLMGGFLALLGGLFWGGVGLMVMLAVGVLGVTLSPGLSPRWVMRMYGASRLDEAQAPGLIGAVRELATRAELPAMPSVYYVPSRMLNAFAVGNRGRSAIAVTDGLLRQLESRELLGVLAHEISHIRNNDLWVMGLADMFSRATSMLSLFGQFLLLLNLPLVLFYQVAINWPAILLLVFAPTLSALAQLALSRAREYDADLNAVRLTGDPHGLASALERIEQVQGGWMERIFLPGRRIPEPSLLRTHPQTAERIRRLASLAKRIDVLQSPADLAGMPGRHGGFGRPVTRPPRWHITGLWH